MKSVKLSILILCCGVFAFSSTSVAAQRVKSPNGRLNLSISQGENGGVVYDLKVDRKLVIDESNMGFRSKGDGDAVDWTIGDVTRESVSDVWRPIWGKRAEVKSCYNEMTVDIESKQSPFDAAQIVFRAYDDGVAFKYILPALPSAGVTLSEELTQFNFAGDYSAWYYNKEFKSMPDELLSVTDGTRLPVMTVKVAGDKYLAIHEADLRVGDPLVLTSKGGETLFEVASVPGGVASGYESAWRVILYGDTPGEIVDSHIIELLNPEPDPSIDFSWVRPGVSVWDWRINGAKVDGFRYTMSYPSWVKMVDFASEQGLTYLMLDANWYGPEFSKDSDPLAGDKAADVKRIIAYAKERGVGVWLYLNDVGGKHYPIEQTLKQYGDWGAAGVKYGFMKGSVRERVLRTEMITRLCAENRLLIDFHDNPIHPSGQMRTWPNAVTREYCHAQLDAHRVFQPSTFTTAVFVNMVAGPLDMNNGMFDLRQGHTDRVDESQPVPSTLASEAARTAIVFSGTTVLPDIPEYYRKYPSLLRFISAQKMPWLESRTLSGEIGKYIVMMRENEEHYIVGAAINEEGGELEIPLDFLGRGEFNAELTLDGEGAHYLTNREVIESQTMVVRSKDVLKVRLAPGGGACLLIEK